ncbi:uncharacterized protein LOC144110550 [Amblyomma americanum]
MNGAYPLSSHELFIGVDATELVKRLQKSTDNATAARLMFRASRKARLLTEAYFRLEKRLYMHFVHLQCRIAMPSEVHACHIRLHFYHCGPTSKSVNVSPREHKNAAHTSHPPTNFSNTAIRIVNSLFPTHILIYMKA